MKNRFRAVTQPAFTCSKLTKGTLEQGMFKVNIKYIAKPCSSVSIVNFKHGIAGWANIHNGTFFAEFFCQISTIIDV